MDRAGKKRLVVGIPPWLLIALVLLAVRLPHSYEMLRADIKDFQTIDEVQQVHLAVEQVVDFRSFFPIPPIKRLPKSLSGDQLEAIMAKERQEEERRHALVMDWLRGGACLRFRATAERALTDIRRAKYVDQKQKTFLRQIVHLKKETMARELAKLNNRELHGLVELEGRHPPPTVGRAEIIAYLLEVNAEQRRRQSSNWPQLKQPPRLKVPVGNGGRASLKVWFLRIESALMRPNYLIDLGILLIPILGLLTVLLPRWRARMVEKSFGLRESTGEFPEVYEIQAFVAEHAPRIELRVNLLHPGYAFVYPRSYRRPRLAVLGGMYTLWRSEPETARGMLLHEIEHVRQGDHLVVGYGSFFMNYIKWIFVSLVILLAMNLIIGTLHSMAVVGWRLEHQVRLTVRQALMALSLTASVFFLMMSQIIVPLLGIWALELNADYGASREQTLHLEGGAQGKVRLGLISKVFGTLTHPPLWLRRWLIKRDDWARGLFRQILFPASFLVAICMFFFMGFFAKLPDKGLRLDTIIWLLGLSLEAFARLYWVFAGMAALLLLWPLLSSPWERIFVGAGRRYAYWDGGRWGVALLLGILSMMAWWCGPSV